MGTVKDWFRDNFCGCGYPDEAIAFLREVFNIFEERKLDSYFINQDQLKILEDKYTRGVITFVLYTIDSSGLTEHGGTVNACWLTDTGKEFVKMFKEFTNEEIEELVL